MASNKRAAQQRETPRPVSPSDCSLPGKPVRNSNCVRRKLGLPNWIAPSSGFPKEDSDLQKLCLSILCWGLKVKLAKIPCAFILKWQQHASSVVSISVALIRAAVGLQQLKLAQWLALHFHIFPWFPCHRPKPNHLTSSDIIWPCIGSRQLNLRAGRIRGRQLHLDAIRHLRNCGLAVHWSREGGPTFQKLRSQVGLGHFKIDFFYGSIW